MEVQILSGQSYFDLAIQYTGIARNAIHIAIANGASVTDKLVAGASLTIPDSLPVDVQIVEYYRSRNIMPATAASVDYNDFDRVFDIEFPKTIS